MYLLPEDALVLMKLLAIASDAMMKDDWPAVKLAVNRAHAVIFVLEARHGIWSNPPAELFHKPDEARE